MLVAVFPHTDNIVFGAVLHAEKQLGFPCACRMEGNIASLAIALYASSSLLFTDIAVLVENGNQLAC